MLRKNRIIATLTAILCVFAFQISFAQRPGEKSYHDESVMPGGKQGERIQSIINALNSKDLYCFARALLTGKLVSSESLEVLWKDYSGENYGYGFRVVEGPKGKVVGHGGGFPGINSNLDIFVDAGYIVAVLSNYDQGANPVARKISQLLARVK